MGDTLSATLVRPSASVTPNIPGLVLDPLPPPPPVVAAPPPPQATVSPGMIPGLVLDDPVPAPVSVPGQIPEPQAVPAQAVSQPPIPGLVLDPVTPPPDPPVDPPITAAVPPATPEAEGFVSSLWSGLSDAYREADQLRSGRLDDGQAHPQVPRTFMGNIGYATAHSAPTLVAGGIGAAGGAALAPESGPIGPVAGAGAGMALGGFVQELIPGYRAARERGLDHDAAVTQAYQLAAAHGAISGLTAPLFELAPVKAVVGKLLFNTFVTQPGIGATERGLVDPAITGQPTPSAGELAEGYVQDVVGGALTGGAIEGGRRVGPAIVRGRYGNVEGITPSGEKGTPGPPIPEQIVGPNGPPADAPFNEPPAPAPPTPPAPPAPPALSAPAPVAVSPEQQAQTAVATLLQQKGVTNLDPGLQAETVKHVLGGMNPQQALDEATHAAAQARANALVGSVEQGTPVNEPSPAAQTPVNEPDVPATPAPPAGRQEIVPAEPEPAPAPVGATGAVPAPAPGVGPERDQPSGGGDSGLTPPAPKPIASEEETPAKAEPPAPAPTTGQDLSQVTTTASNRKLNTAFEVHEASDLVQASGDLQPRDREGRAIPSEMQRREIYANFDPERLHASPEADRGSPIIDENKTLITGNNRTKVIQEVHQRTEPEAKAKADAYRAMIQRVTGQDVSRMKEPVLVRRLQTSLTPEEKASVAREANVGATQEMSEPEQAKVDAKSLTPDQLNKFRAEQDLTSAGNRSFVQDFVKSVPQTEHNTILNAETGALSQAGQRRLRNAILARAYGDDGILSRGLESTNDETRAITSGLMDASQPMAKLRAAIEDGTLDKQYDLSKDIARATDLVRSAREKGRSLDDILNQQDMFGGATLPASQEALVRAFYNPAGTKAASRTSIANTLREYARLAQEQGRDMLGEAGRSPDKILKELVDARARKGEQGALMDANPGEKAATAPNAFDAGHGDIAHEDIPPEFLPEGTLIPLEEETPARPEPADPPDVKELQDQLDKLHAKNTPAALAQAQKLQTRISRARAAWRDKHVTSQPGRKITYAELKYAPGTSRYNEAFKDAGHDPRTMTSRPLAEQNAILSKLVQDKFGFQEVKVLPGADPKQSRDQLLDTYHAGQDLMNAFSMPPTALSANGRLTLRLEGKGRKYYGVYEPGTMTVGIVGQSQSYMHEWVHAVDHLLSDQFVNHPNKRELLSMNARDNELVPGQPQSVPAAFARLLNTMFYDDVDLAVRILDLENIAQKTTATGQPQAQALAAQAQLERLAAASSRLKIRPSEFRKNAGLQPNPQYWASLHEMLARAGEMYIARQAQNAGVNPRGLVLADEAYQLAHDPRVLATFPQGDERLRILVAYGNLFDAMKRDAVFPGGVAPRSTDFGMADPSTWGRQGVSTPQGRRIQRWFAKDAASWRARDENRRSLWSDETRPESPLTLKERGLDVWREYTASSMSMMDALIKRQPDAAKPFFQELRDKLMHAPGTGRYVPQVWEERVRQRSRRTIDTYTRAMKQHGLENMTLEQRDMLRHMLVSGDTAYPVKSSMQGAQEYKPIPDNIREAHAKVRRLLDEEYDHNKRAGIDIQYVKGSGYFPAMYDDPAIGSNQDGFVKAATELHKLIFDKDVGETNPDPAKMLEWWDDVPGPDKALAGATMRGDLAKLGKHIKRINEIDAQLQVLGAGSPGHNALTTERTQLMDDAQIIADLHADKLGTLVGERAAYDWNIRIQAGHSTDFETRGPSARYTRGRVLPPEADRIMRDFMVTDPDAAIPMYLEASARRTAFVEQFGGGDGKTQSLIDRNLELAAAAGSHGDDITRMRAIVENVTGRTRNTYSRTMVQATNYIHAFAMLRLLPRTAFAAVHEPMSAALSTGDFKLALDTFARQIKNIFSEASAQETAELADELGITTNILSESVMNSRTTDYKENPHLSRIMSSYYRMIGLTQITQAVRRATVASGTNYLRRMANRASAPPGGAGSNSGADTTKVANQRDNAQRMLRELGVPDEHHAGLATWLNGIDGLPRVEQLHDDQNRGMSDLYSQAMFRLVNRVNQDPLRVQKPMHSGNPVGKLTFALMPFLYSYTQQVLEPAVERITHAYGRQYDRSRKAGGGKASSGARAAASAFGAGWNVLGAAAALVGTALLTTIPYQFLFNRDQWEKHEKEGDLGSWLLGLSVSRSGVGGTIDPLVNAATNARYSTDFAKLMEGAPVSTLMTDAFDLLLKPWTAAGQGNTNAATWDQTQAAFKLLYTPTLLFGLTQASAMFPGGPLAAAAAIMAWKGTAPDTLHKMTDIVAGERGTKTGEPSGQGRKLHDLPGLKGLKSLPTLGQPEKGAKDKGHGGGGMMSAAGALADDVALPFARALPGPLKAVGIAFGTAYAGWDYWNRTAAGRSGTPPDKP